MATKVDIINEIHQRIHDPLSKARIEAVVDAYHDAVVSLAKSQDKVTIRGFGSFRVRESAARTGRNPKTGEAVEIPARKALAFKASQSAL